jgi:hypothetical protein
MPGAKKKATARAKPRKVAKTGRRKATVKHKRATPKKAAAA